MKWEEHLEQLNRDDEEYEAVSSVRQTELENLEYNKNDMSKEDYQKWLDEINDITDANSAERYLKKHNLMDYNSDFMEEYGEPKEYEEKLQNHLADWSYEYNKEHPDTFRRYEWNRSMNSLYFYNKKGEKIRISTHEGNYNNGSNIHDYRVDRVEVIPSLIEDGRYGRDYSFETDQKTFWNSAGSLPDFAQTPKTIIPYDQLKNYKNQEDTFEADEDRQEEDSNNLSKKEIRKYE